MCIYFLIKRKPNLFPGLPNVIWTTFFYKKNLKNCAPNFFFTFGASIYDSNTPSAGSVNQCTVFHLIFLN